ncbi:MAG: flagellar basal body P-ring formation protein FlgA [Acidobacteriaceae bacterium]|nr:flagellar basal body P-ring formation protein FlgA [Acidobacteriaceae bacterium]
MMLPVLLAMALTTPICRTISADRIYGHDLANALPVFKDLPSDLPIGLSPVPGQQRVFHPNELRRIALGSHIEGNVTESVCFSWSMSVPSRDAIRSAMERALTDRHATIEILDGSMSPAPPGEMIFPLTGLSGSSEGPVLWRGSVQYAPNHNFTIWARVRITVKEQRVVATELLLPGEEIRPEQVKMESYEGPLTRDNYCRSLQEVIGLLPQNSIPANTALQSTFLRERKDVERGDLVAVVVQSERTRLEAQGIAEDGGRHGSVITIRNAKSGKKFRARIEDKDRVLVLATSSAGLAVEGGQDGSSNL